MAGLNRPAIVIAGIAGLCVSAATGIGLGTYTATGMNPLYTLAHNAPSYSDESTALDGSVGDSAAVDHVAQAAAHSVGGDDFADRTNDES
ncbi:MAG: hypothetical protein JWL96_3056 [Sphingomonas bacterium]|uniref:hypothetical protein n=1 Tax=Sphingomonas bacterium TaxID=1895847 RepID=UPI00261CE5FA|nr:hypothetical protein [Sphingomonas bacterium]MDB5710986.1 hypothetical protein [Sphingomonas bacterium]